jgi:hypothetical protein
MWGVLKELLLVLAIGAALFAVAAQFSGPTEGYLHTGRTCHEVIALLVAKHYRALTPAEETDRANCEN